MTLFHFLQAKKIAAESISLALSPALHPPICSLFPFFSFLSLRDYVQYWAERDVEVVGWTVNTAVEKDYYQNLLNIGFITDSLLEDCDPHYWMMTHSYKVSQDVTMIKNTKKKLPYEQIFTKFHYYSSKVLFFFFQRA